MNAPIRTRSLRTWLLLVTLASAVGWLAGVAHAADLRDFSGTVEAISGGSVTVESRMGGSRSFARRSDTRVAGARKKWEEIRPGDRVVVSWSISDAKPEARGIRVVGRAGG